MRNLKRILTVVVTSTLIMLGLSVPAHATVRWGCPSGVGCVWTGYAGAGSRLTVSVGQYGVGNCYVMPGTWFNADSSTSDDYGSGIRLWLYDNDHCASLQDFSFKPISLGMWSFNTISLLKYDNKAESFILLDTDG